MAAGRVAACLHCGKIFTPEKTAKQIYCSHQCANDAVKKRSARVATCPVCGIRFLRKDLRQKYCSVAFRDNAKAAKDREDVRSRSQGAYQHAIERFLAGEVIVFHDNVADDYVGIRKVKCFRPVALYAGAVLSFNGLDTLADIDERDTMLIRQPDFNLGF